MDGRHEERGHFLEPHSHDPVKRSWREDRSVNWYWLRDGQKLTPVQRCGYGMVSAVYLGFAVVLLDAASAEFHDSSGEVSSIFFGLGFSVACFCLLYLGIQGLRNVFRLPRH